MTANFSISFLFSSLEVSHGATRAVTEVGMPFPLRLFSMQLLSIIERDIRMAR